MSIKSLIESFIPSYRIGKSILQELYIQTQQNKVVLSRLNEMDKKNEYMFWLLAKLSNEIPEDTKKRIFLEMPKATGNLRRLQLAQNWILQRIKDICDANGIKFSLYAGTLLGAYRHKGFIPWDDDIDIAMMTKDYEKLKTCLSNDKYLTICRYYQYFGGSVVKIKFKCNESVFIDIFTYDYISVDASHITECFNKSQEMAEKYSQKIANKIKEKHLYELAKMRPIYDEEIDELSTEYYNDFLSKNQNWYNQNSGNYMVKSVKDGFVFRNGLKYMRTDEVLPLLNDYLFFEGKCYDIYKNYFCCLTQWFGDFMSLPQNIDPKHNTEYSCELDMVLNQIEDLLHISLR